MSFEADCHVVGKRAAIYLSNEAEGFGPWVRPRIFGFDLCRVNINADWIPVPHKVPQQRRA